MNYKYRQISKALAIIVVLLLLGIVCTAIVYAKLQTPSLDRTRHHDQAIMPQMSISGDLVTIQNIRNIHYRDTEDYDVSYYDQIFDLAQLDEIWFIVEPFSSIRGPAHTFLSFGFAGKYVSISVETRKEIGEHYDPLYGMVNGYELLYVIASEQDVIGLRANHRKDDVYLYPIRTSKENMRLLFVDMVTRAQNLSQNPEFYHTITDNCTSTLWRHINELSSAKIPLHISLILPYWSDHFAYDLGLIDSNLSFKETKQLYHINEIASQCPEDEMFSSCIRNGLRDRIEAD